MLRAQGLQGCEAIVEDPPMVVPGQATTRTSSVGLTVVNHPDNPRRSPGHSERDKRRRTVRQHGSELDRCATQVIMSSPPLGGCMQILVVDDSKVMREMIVACLRPLSDASFAHAASGLEAIERLSLGQFDLVFLDLNMPD